MITQNIKKIASITGLFFGAFALSVFATDWSAATQIAPAGNTAAPINVSITGQYKEGPLAVGKNSGPTSGYDLDVDGVGFFYGVTVSGDTKLLGNVGIGTNSPTKKLEVVGGPIKATGGLIIETRTAAEGNPTNPESGRIWMMVP